MGFVVAQIRAVRRTVLPAIACLLAWLPAVAREVSVRPDYGRFSERLVRCSLSSPTPTGGQRACNRLRIDQNLEGLLSVRFAVSGGGERSGGENLVFAGMLAGSSAPMNCRGDGRCQPEFPVELSVNAIANFLYDRRGLAATLPRALVVRGQCRIEALRARCEATGSNGEQWRAEGFFPVTAPPDPRSQR